MNVRHLGIQGFELTGDEHGTVACERLPLRTEEGDPSRPRLSHDPLEPAPKEGRLREPPVLNPSILVTRRVLRSCAQLGTKKQIADAAGIQGPPKLLPA